MAPETAVPKGERSQSDLWIKWLTCHRLVSPHSTFICLCRHSATWPCSRGFMMNESNMVALHPCRYRRCRLRILAVVALRRLLMRSKLLLVLATVIFSATVEANCAATPTRVGRITVESCEIVDTFNHPYIGPTSRRLAL